MQIGVVEDDYSVASAIVDVLEANLITASRMSRGAELLTRHSDFDLVLLDLDLPDMDGIDVLRHLRQVSAVPVIILSARDDERSVVRGLRNGADDYLVKPARTSELLARVQAIRRRARQAADSATGLREFGDVLVDLSGRTLKVAGEQIPLTTKEFQLLELLVDNPGTAISRQHLMDRIWGDSFVTHSRSLDVHMTALRSKIGSPGLIVTIRGFGYRWAGQP